MNEFFDKCSNQDNYHLITIMCNILSEIAKPQQNDFFDYFLNKLPDACNEKFEIFSAKVNITIDNKKFKKSVADMVTFYKEFLVTCQLIVPKQYENAPPVINLYRKVLNKLVDTIDNSFVDVSEKTSREIYMIACLADAHIVALSDDRQNIRIQYTKEINKFVQTSMTVPFGKLLPFLDEIDKKLASSVSDSNIQAFVYNNRSDYKKYTKDFNLKNKYCVRVPEMSLALQAKDIENWIQTLE
ncbi:hypothetical protein MXB_851 [Myxobolus squamalis]|nr:hypothetical protein MXB_851 [Myxobolus squamalis]